MITVAKLEEMGCNTKEGLARCMNNEKFYLKMLPVAIKDNHFELLEKAIADKDIQAAYDAAHALKGSTGNLGITPLYKTLSKMSDMLKAGMNADYASIYNIVKVEREKFLKEL